MPFFREFPGLKAKKVNMAILVLRDSWDLQVYLVHRYVITSHLLALNSCFFVPNLSLYSTLLPQQYDFRQGYPGLKGEKGEKGESVSVFFNINCVHFKTILDQILI